MVEEQEARDALSRSQMEARMQKGLAMGGEGVGKGKAFGLKKGHGGRTPVEAGERVRMSKSNVLLIGPTGASDFFARAGEDCT